MFLLAFGVLVFPSYARSSAATQVAQLPVIERRHQIVAVGPYLLPEPLVLPPTVTTQPVATGYFSPGPHRALTGVSIFFFENEDKAVLAWAQAFPIVVTHPGTALWQSQHSYFLVQDKSAAGNYVLSGQPISGSEGVWRIYGTFFTQGWTYGIAFQHGDYFVGRTTYPLPITKNSFSLLMSFSKRPDRVWLPLHEKNHRIVSIGPYQLPDPVVLPTRLNPLSLALVTFVRSSPSTHLSLRVFFPLAEESAVFDWISSSPTIAANSPRRWQPRSHAFWTKSSRSANGISFSDTALSATVPAAWSFNGPLPAEGGQIFLGVSGGPVVSAADIRVNASARILFSGGAADYVGDADDYGRNSPLKGEQRHVSLRVEL